MEFIFSSVYQLCIEKIYGNTNLVVPVYFLIYVNTVGILFVDYIGSRDFFVLLNLVRNHADDISVADFCPNEFNGFECTENPSFSENWSVVQLTYQ